jgi:hypothetical protein
MQRVRNSTWLGAGYLLVQRGAGRGLRRIMSEVMHVAAHFFRRKHYKDEELSGLLGRKEGRESV